jgi:sugar (pentulose or hexulose) kinase
MYLAFDVGTTSVKTALYDREGRLLHKVIRDYRLDSPHLDWYELDPEIYWRSVREGFQEALNASGAKPAEVKAVCGCSQGETIILLDRNGKPLRPAIVWYDNRSRGEVEELKTLVDGEELYRRTGLLEMEPTWSAPKLLWVKKHERDVFERIWKILLVEDYIVYRLTGRAVTSTSLMSTSALVDIHERKYWGATVDRIGVRDMLPEIVEETAAVGHVSREVAGELGLGNDVVVVKGSMDHDMGAIGVGNIRPGIVTETTGSALAIGLTADRKNLPRAVKLPHQPHIIPGAYLVLPYALTAGIVYKWFRDEFAREEMRALKNPDAVYNALNELAAAVPAGAEGLVALPFLAGASFPENDTYAKGVFYGLAMKHGRGHMVRSIMESIAFMLRKILVALLRSGARVEEIRSMGGGARSDLWLQIKADVCGYPFVRMETEETSLLGAAIVGGVKVGDFASIEEAVNAVVKPSKRFTPDRTKAEAYEKAFALYGELYDSLKPLFRKYS